MADVESLELQITGNAKSAKASIDALIDTLDRLKTATSGGCGLGSVATGLEKVERGGRNSSSANNKNAKSFGNLATKITAAYVALSKGANIVASWITESNEYIENLNLFSVAMGEYAESAYEYGQKVSDVMGIDVSDWIRNQGVFMTLATGFGVAGDRAATMSQQLTQLGYDLSSFYNISVEDAMQKLQSGIAGELEPLRRLGYDLSQAKLEATALSLGIDKTVSSMTQAEKAELRYYAIMNQVTMAQGDMARTLEAPANQLRVLQAQVTQAARAFGNLFIPVLNAVLPVVIAAVKVITMLAQSVASLFGITLEVDFSDSGMNNLGSSAGDASDAIGDAADNAKKLKKMLLGIDELNVMSDTSGSSADSNSGGGGGFDFELPTYDFLADATSQRVNEIVEKIKEWLGITGEITSWSDLFDTRLGDILETVGLIGLAFAAWKLTNGFMSAIGVVQQILANPALSLTIGATIAIIGFKLAFDGMGDAIKDGLDGFNFGKIIGGSLFGTGGVALLGSKIAVWLEAAFKGKAVSYAIAQAGINLGKGTIAATGATLAAGGAGIVLGIGAMFVGIYDAIKNGIDWLSAILIPAGGAAAGAGAAVILTALGTTLAPGLGTLIGLAVGLLIDGIILLVQNWEAVSAWFTTVFATVGQFFTNLWQSICDVWNVCAEWFDTNVIQPVVGFFTGLWEGISSAASDCWAAIVEFFTPAFEWFSELFGSIWQTISDIFYDIGVIANGCWEIIKACWEIVSGWVDENIIQPVSDFFSDMWEGISTWATEAWENIKSVFSTISNWIDTHIIQPVSGFFSELWEGFSNAASLAWEGVKEVFSAVGKFFKETFEEAWAGIVGIFSVAGEIFVDIKDGVVDAFKAVVNGLIDGINKVVAVPFEGINSTLRWLRDLTILEIQPFSSIKTISIPSIPHLADGGTVNEGQMFVAREAGPELVGNVGRKTTVMNNDQIVDSVSRGVYNAVVAAMGQSSGAQVVEARVNDKVLFEVVVDRNRQETMRTGYSPLLGGV